MADATTEPRVSDERLGELTSIAVDDPREFLRCVLEYGRAVLDLRDARATIASQAEALAAKEAEIERLAEAVTMLPNKTEPNGVTPRPPGNPDWWSTAVAERRQRKAAEAALKAAREAGEVLRRFAHHAFHAFECADEGPNGAVIIDDKSYHPIMLMFEEYGEDIHLWDAYKTFAALSPTPTKES